MKTTDPTDTTDANNAKANPKTRYGRLTTNTLVAAGMAAALVALGIHRGGAPQNQSYVLSPNPTHATSLAATSRPRVEMVFALDTTGSMGNLLEGAKRKIWSLASFVARGQPTPDLRVGLVAYRDRGDAYVTRVFDLDDDLDRVYAQLRDFKADGGGDGPEHVARALHDAVHSMSWSQNQSSGQSSGQSSEQNGQVVRIVYLVGDAPPHNDYDDGFDLDAAARAAREKGIEVHAIRCGTDPETEVAWRRVAEVGQGEFLTIQQDGGMKDVATPFDGELARLHDELTSTGMGYGSRAGEIAAAKNLALAASAEVKASRAGYMAAKKAAVGGKGDLVDDWAKGKVNLDAIPPSDLPATLQGLPLASQEAQLLEKNRQRKDLVRQIEALTEKREAHIAEADEGEGGPGGFDKVAKEALRRSVADNKVAGFKL